MACGSFCLYVLVVRLHAHPQLKVRRSATLHIPQLEGGHTVTGDPKFSPVAPFLFFCLAPKTLQSTQIKM